ncbi:glycine-rich domain-containing protein [Amycolatopsis thermoflava]|uniref:glycine-rich domain-containing protein n=1 Tax=Amycolatopsis thermoflava TaxID=84480 RepID=UPI003D744DE6
MTAVMNGPVTGRSLVSHELFNRLARRLAVEEKLDPGLSERIVDQALAFLAACATNCGAPLAPSELVDLGWHTFVLHTKDYAEFCDRVAGRFLHHVPTDESDPSAGGPAARDTLVRTMSAIRGAGYTLDVDLWPHPDADHVNCSQCKNGCYDDPPPAQC